MEESQFPIPSFYAFRYANKAAAGYQHCSYVVASFITPFLFLHIIISIMFMADLDKYISFEPLLWVLFVCGIIGLVLSIKYATGFKGVTLYKDHLEITMHSLFTKRFRPTVSIMYKDIASVYNSRLNLRSQGMRQKWSMGGLWRLSVLYGNPPAKRQANLCFRRKSGGLCPRAFRPH